ncbi:phospholipid methyltransferase-domain-containing protein [Mucidula mucida]|nr:phospholipid methyltransferase-domain-containing protein [Mucidula mucida]
MNALTPYVDAAKPYVDLTQPSFWLSIASITFNPTAWNIVARNEYHNKTITRVFGSPKAGCYFLAFMIFSFGMLRDHLFNAALAGQPTSLPALAKPFDTYLPIALVAAGQILVVSSTWALGVTGTFLGDYFGILMDARVDGFPFNILTNPMYVGSTMCFLGVSLWFQSIAGLVITFYVYVVYVVALRFEGPFTDMIYAKREEARAAKKE